MKTGMSWLILGLCCGLFIGSASSCAGVTPDMRLPEWNRFEPRIVGWDGKNKLSLELEVHALKVKMLQLSAGVIWTPPLQSSDRPEKLAALEAGKTWKTAWTATVPDSFDGWFEIDLQALPDTIGLEKVITDIATLSAMSKEILTKEAQGFKAPIQIGRTVSLHVDPGMATLLPRHLLFSPVWITGNRALLLWQPAGLLGSGQVSESWNAFCQAVPTQDTQAAVVALAKLQKLLTNATEPVPLRGVDQGQFALAPQAILEAIEVNLATLRASEKPSSEPSSLLLLAEKGGNNFTKPFAWANLGILHALGNRPEPAKKAWEKALELQPGWPMLRGWLEALKGGKR